MGKVFYATLLQLHTYYHLPVFPYSVLKMLTVLMPLETTTKGYHTYKEI